MTERSSTVTLTVGETAETLTPSTVLVTTQ